MKIVFFKSKFFLILVSLVIGLLLSEACCQLIYFLNYDSPLPYGIIAGRANYIKLKNNFTGTSRIGILYKTNSMGYRGDEIDYNLKHIIFIGDSTTFGLNINYDDTFAKQTETLINNKITKKEFQAINASASAMGTFDELEVLNDILGNKRLNIKAVILGFFGNDFEGNYQYYHKKKRLKDDFWFKLKENLANNIGMPRTFLYLREIYRTHTNYDNKIGVITTRFRNNLDRDIILNDESYRLTLNALDEIHSKLRKRNIPFIFIYLPSGENEILSGKAPLYKELLVDYLIRKGIICLDPLPLYTQYLNEKGFINKLPEGFYSYGKDAAHPGPLPCKIIAERLVLILHKIL